MDISHLNAKDTGRVLKRLMNEHDEYHWAVAWATESPLSEQLIRYKKKIKRLVFGIDFYHTSPEILRKLMPVKWARINQGKHGATFHPKVYAFVSGENAAVLIGSSNFTNGGTLSNNEACLLLEGSTRDQPIKSLMRDVEVWWEDGVKISEEFLDDYQHRYEATKEQRKNLEQPIIRLLSHKSQHANLLNMTWGEYVRAMNKLEEGHLKRRIKILQVAQSIFAEANSFGEIDAIERKAIAGHVGERELDSVERIKGLDWGWFGSMKGAGVFRSKVVDSKTELANRHLIEAVNCIPLKGAVTAENYKKFLEYYRKSFVNSPRKGGLAPASRLLAIKRPDYFCCVNGENIAGLAGDLGVSQNHLNLDNYWDLVVKKLMDSKWWKVDRPGGLNGQIWDGRIALLDGLYYTPDVIGHG